MASADDVTLLKSLFSGLFPVGNSSSKETQKYFLEYGAATAQGPRARQEDRFDVHLMYGADQSKAYFGVYDGHFGTKAAEFCRDNLAKHIISNADFDRDPVSAIKRSIGAVDTAFLERAARRSDPSGATILSVVLLDTLLVVSNLGDCRLFAHHQNALLPLTKTHKPTTKVERRRIRRNGGHITHKRLNGRLAFSRAIGDIAYKNLADIDDGLLISSPDTIITKIDANVDYLLLATDGLLQKLSLNEIDAFIKSSYAQSTKIAQIADSLARFAIERGADDNVTLILVGFRHKRALTFNARRSPPRLLFKKNDQVQSTSTNVSSRTRKSADMDIDEYHDNDDAHDDDEVSSNISNIADFLLDNDDDETPPTSSVTDDSNSDVAEPFLHMPLSD